jgi:hypothetical protein
LCPQAQANTMPGYLTDSGHMILLLSALEHYESTVDGQCQTSILLKKSVNLQYFAKFVIQKGSSKVTLKTSLINSHRKKKSDNKSAPCSYWPLAHNSNSNKTDR